MIGQRKVLRGPCLLIHGGAGSLIGHEELLATRRSLLSAIVVAVWPRLLEGVSATAIAQQLVEEMENAPALNAGRGAYMQRDGLVRLSSSIMDGEAQRFSAVALASHIINPSRLAHALQDRPYHNLGPGGAALLARELNLPLENPATAKRASQWAKLLEENPALSGEASKGTVGAVVRDREGRLAACTSTGGHATNYPERMSDVSTPAGNYASAYAAVSCTGVGEEIINDGVAVRIDTRVRDGATLVEACTVGLKEAESRNREYGWIALDPQGHASWAHTTPHMPIAWMNQDLTAPETP